MTVSSTLRFLLKKYSSGGDPHPSRIEFNAMIDTVENNAAMFSQGPTGSRPTAGKVGRWYWDETVARMYYDDGTAWKDQNPNGGGGAGTAVVPNVGAVEGTSARAARADHTHSLAMATTLAPGAMSAAHKALLDTATANATNDALMKRDSSGRASVGTPTASVHAATKGYVDGQITSVGSAAADYTDAAITAAPVATGTTAGKMSAADKSKLDAATSAQTPSTIVRRSAGGGYFDVATPTSGPHPANKSYVDAQINALKARMDAAGI